MKDNIVLKNIDVFNLEFLDNNEISIVIYQDDVPKRTDIHLNSRRKIIMNVQEFDYSAKFCDKCQKWVKPPKCDYCGNEDLISDWTY